MDENIKNEVERYKQWVLGITEPRRFVLPKATFDEHSERNYNLKNKKIEKYLQYEKQRFGINLGWTDSGENATGLKVARWFFARKGDNDGPIQYGETIAIGYGKSPSFIRFKQRNVGINLDWSKKPVYEWKLLGGKIGQPVSTKDRIAIYNMVSEGGECLIHFERAAGGHIGWPTSKPLLEGLLDFATKELIRMATAKLLSGS